MDVGTIRRLVEATVVAEPVSSPSPYLIDQHILLVDDGSDLVVDLTVVLRQQGARVLLLQPTPVDRPAPTIPIDLSQPSAFEQIVERLHQISTGLLGILWIQTRTLPWGPDWLDQAYPRVLAAIALAKGISQSQPLSFYYWVTAQGGRFGHDTPAAVDALAPGFEALVHPLRMEMPKTSFRAIDLDPQTPTPQQAQQILAELSQPDQEFRVAYGWKDGKRVTLTIQEIPTDTRPLSLTPQSVVVFAGGARGIGAVCAKALATQCPCQILFLGRTPLDPDSLALSRLSVAERKAEEQRFIQAYKNAHPGCSPREPREAWKQRSRGVEAAETLAQIRSLGAHADYFPVDVRDPRAVQQVLTQIQERCGRPDLIVHVAGLGGVETDRMLSRKDWPVIERVLDTKVTGAVNLLQAATSLGVPRFLGFGSIASRFGNSGQVDYACANALLAGIVRAHNAQGQLPVARVIGWGAWDEVGIAVSGATKQMLQSYGVQFIDPTVGGQAFLGELAPQLSPLAPAEVFLSPSWTGLQELLHQEAEPISSSAPLLGQICQYQPGEFLRAEHELHPQTIPFLDHHRYDGTAWVPAVLGLEVAVEAASQLLPQLIPYALRDIHLKKAIRLVRDEPALLITEASTQSCSPQEACVAVTVSGSYKGRTWVFAEMNVILTADRQPIQACLQEGVHHHRSLPIQQEPGELITYSRTDLYPSDWLRFQTQGSTFQVIETLRLQCSSGRTEGRMQNTADLSDCLLPMTLIDGVFQAYGVTLCTLLQTWAGPPLFIGEIGWLPEAPQVNEVTFAIRTDLTDKKNYPILHMFDTSGQCILRMQQADQGGTSLKELRARRPQAMGSTDTRVAPYLGTVTELEPGHRLRAEQLLDPAQEVLLRDHQFNIFVVVPAVYFMEVAVEAAAQLLPQPAPCEIRDFHIHQALHLLNNTQTLLIAAERVGENVTQVRLSSHQKGGLRLHAEGLVIHGTPASLGCRPLPNLEGAEVRRKADLYPQRFPNGPIFQVIEQMAWRPDHLSCSQLRLTAPLPDGCYLPITFLDGAFQVDSATRSGFNRTSGLPKCFSRLCWASQVAQLTSVRCLASTGSDRTDAPGEVFLVDEDHKVLLHLSGIILTSPLPSLHFRRSE